MMNVTFRKLEFMKRGYLQIFLQFLGTDTRAKGLTCHPGIHCANILDIQAAEKCQVSSMYYVD